MTQQRELDPSTDQVEPPAATGDSDSPVRPDPETPEGQGDLPGRRRLLGEAVGISLITVVVAYFSIPALKDRQQTFYEDVINNWFGPQAHGLGELIRKGIWLPVWLRTNYGGEPYLANTQHGATYPGNLPFWLFETSAALEIAVVLHFILASVSMWAYCRFGLRTSMWAGWLAAICFSMGASALAHITLGGQVMVILLMPLTFLTGHMALETRKLRWVVGCAVSIGLGFLAGHVEEWLYIVVALALYGVCWILFKERGGIVRRLGWATLTLGGAVGLFVLLFAWQLFPSVLLSRQTYRNSPGFRQQFALPRDWAFNALLPDFNHVLIGENEAFIGLAATCLIGLAFVTRDMRLLWVRMFVLLSCAIGLLFALGNQDPVYRFLYEHVSVLRGFRVPSRWLLLPSFGLCVGAALGLDKLLTAHVGQWKARILHGLAGVGVLVLAAGGALLVVDMVNNGTHTLKWWALAAAIGGFAWLIAGIRKVPRAIPALVILAITAVELAHGRPGSEWRQKVPNQVYDEYGPNLAVLSEQGGRYLTVIGGPKNATQAAKIPIPEGVPNEPVTLAYYRVGVASRVSARPDANLAVQAETIAGRDGGFLPLRWYREFYYAAAGGGGDLNSGNITAPPSKWNWTALDLLAVKWFITDDELPASERAVLEREGFRVDGQYGYAVRWKRDGTQLARLVHQVDVIPSGPDRLARLQAGYSLLDRAIVEEPVTIDSGSAAGADSVETSTQLDGTVDIRVRTDRTSLLVLADAWYPGWKVTVDGESADLVRTNHAFRGVVVPAGEHEVRFTFTDRPMQAGGLIAGLTILGLALIPLAIRRRRGRDEADADADPDGGPDGRGPDGRGPDGRGPDGRGPDGGSDRELDGTPTDAPGGAAPAGRSGATAVEARDPDPPPPRDS